MKLTKLHIHGYRDLAPGTELVFSPALNLVLGENGTGRTTLLELLSRVLAADFSGLIREEFSLEYSLAFPGMDLHISVRNARPSGTSRPVDSSREVSALLPPRPPEAAAELEPFMELVLELDASAPRLVMRADATGVSWEVDGQPAYSQNMYWSLLDRTVWVVLFMTAQRLEPEVREPLKELLRRTFLLAPARFDEALGTFQQIGNTQYGMEMRGEEVFPLGLMWLPTWMPGLLRERVEREMPRPGGFLDIRHDEVERSFLAKFVTLAGFTSGLFRAELLDKRSYEGGGRLEFGRFGFHFTRRDGSVLTQAHLGHGQKRLLSFLYYLDVNEDFVIADELANSLHPRHVEACMRELGRRQSFLTSQNPLLFEHVPLGSADEVRASLIHCGTELRDGREWKVCANPTPETAEKLFSVYQRGDTPLATLLRTHGLW
ncbi:AAA family ATPase [Archangium lansingense]|uniref:AAA family ATPase n=1 Tax=Archangium lansingense TaxID=2995310 RepID=A0ABT4A2U1_9BACT|nr:AAA family ATPase [Archangium lansinium]MCY1075960.1 AAA family ATPase [Archangium lansinium]